MWFAFQLFVPMPINKNFHQKENIQNNNNSFGRYQNNNQRKYQNYNQNNQRRQNQNSKEIKEIKEEENEKEEVQKPKAGGSNKCQ